MGRTARPLLLSLSTLFPAFSGMFSGRFSECCIPLLLVILLQISSFWSSASSTSSVSTPPPVRQRRAQRDLCHAVWQGDAATAAAVLARDDAADPHAPCPRTARAATPLFLAAHALDEPLVRVLVNTTSTTAMTAADGRDTLGMSPLHAVVDPYASVLAASKCALRRRLHAPSAPCIGPGSPIARRNIDRLAALLLQAATSTTTVSTATARRACTAVATRVIRALIDSGANVSARDNFGQSVLHRAAEGGVVVFAELLLHAGANVSAVDNEGHTPLDRARVRGHVDMVRLLTTMAPTITAPQCPDDIDRDDVNNADKDNNYMSGIAQAFAGNVTAPQCPDDIDRDDVNNADKDNNYMSGIAQAFAENVTADAVVAALLSATPLVIRRSVASDTVGFARARQAWSPAQLATTADSLRLPAGSIPYPSVFGGEMFHAQISAQRYLSSYGSGNNVTAAKLRLPVIFAKVKDSVPLLGLAEPLEALLPPVLRQLQAKRLLMPTCLQLSLGVAGSGAAWHYHTEAASVLVHGKRRWWFLDAAESVLSSLPAEAPAGTTWRSLRSLVQHSGDVVLVPNRVGHMTLNEEVSVGVTIELAGRRPMEPFYTDP